MQNCLYSLFFVFIELDNAGVIQGFDFVLSFLLDGVLRGECLSNKLSILLKVLEYLQKTKTLKITFFLDQSFGIGLINIMLLNITQTFFVFSCFFALTFLKSNSIKFCFSLT